MSADFKDDMRDLWAAVNQATESARRIEVAATRIEGETKRIDALFVQHVQDKAVHHYPPCRTLENLSLKLWGLLVLSLSGMGAAIWAFVRAHG